MAVLDLPPVRVQPAQNASERIAGLDGLRGLAVLLVVVYHLWPRLLPGGFLGVTLFFSLSGFLMVRLLTNEREMTGTVRLRAFYGRRARRLVPASLLVLTIVAVVWTVAGWMTAEIQRDLRFSLAQMANWGQLWSGERYGVGGEPSPVLHFWSLAIEEQVYLVLPLLVIAAGTRRRLALALSAGVVLSVLTTLRADGDAVVVYYSTFTRMGEVLVGGLLALVSVPALRALGAFAVGGMLALVLLARTWSVADDVVHDGGLLVVGLLAGLVVFAVANGPSLGALLDRWPLAWWGRISYGIYLYHWPLLIAFGAMGWSSRWTPWATLVLTVVLADLSARWFEHPIRMRAGRVGGSRMVLVSGAALAVTGCLVAAALVPSRGPVADFEAATAELQALAAVETRSVPPAVSSPVPKVDAGPAGVPGAPARTVSYGYIGDSKAMALALGSGRGELEGWDFGPILTGLGCPVGRGGHVRHEPRDPGRAVAPVCDWTAFASERDDASRPMDVAMVWFGTWDVLDRRVSALGDRWLTMADAEYRAWLLAEWEALTSGLMATYAPQLIVLLTLPPVADPGREEEVAAWNLLLQDVAARSEHPVEVLDVAAWIESTGDGARLLPDGVHLTYQGDDGSNTAAEVHRVLVGPTVERLLDARGAS